MKIRQENQNDHAAVYEVIREAFATAEHSDGNEQDLVTALRKSASFIPELSLVAIEDKTVVGHILFTKVRVGENIELALAPLSVAPNYQRKGIGLALMETGHRLAAAMGYDCSVVLGDPDYYSRGGYIPASIYGIRAPFDVPDENFMALKLNDGISKIEGMVRYDTAFGIN